MTCKCGNCGSTKIQCDHRLIKSNFNIEHGRRMDQWELNIVCNDCKAILDTDIKTLFYPSHYTMQDAADAVTKECIEYLEKFLAENSNVSDEEKTEEADISGAINFDCASFGKCNRCHVTGFVSLEQSIINNKMHFAVKCHYCDAGTPMCSSTQDALKLWGEMNAR